MEFKPIASSSAGNAYILHSQGSKFILDPGITWKNLLPHIGLPSSVAGAFVSHNHQDHCKGVQACVENMIRIFASKECRDELSHQITKPEVRKLFGERSFDLPPLVDVDVVQSGWRIIGIPVQHDAPGTMAAMVKAPDGDTLFFLTDAPYSPALPSTSPTIIAVECNYSSETMAAMRATGQIKSERYRRVLQSHMSSDHCLAFLTVMKENGLLSKTREIHLLHLSDAHSNEAQILQQVRSLTGIATFVAQKQAVPA